MNRTAWVIGASSGVGAHVAELLRDRDYRVAVSARRTERLREVAGDTMTVAPADVTDIASVQDAAEVVIAALGAPDVVVYAAGYWQRPDPGQWSFEEFHRHVDVNLLGFGRVLDAVLPSIRERGSGRLVVVASVAGYRGVPGAEYYGPTKAALVNLSESLRASLKQSGVQVTTVCPGFVDTEMTESNDFPMPFMVDADRAAREIVDGIEDGRQEIVFPKRMAAVMKTARVLPVRVWSFASARMARGTQDDG